MTCLITLTSFDIKALKISIFKRDIVLSQSSPSDLEVQHKNIKKNVLFYVRSSFKLSTLFFQTSRTMLKIEFYVIINGIMSNSLILIYIMLHFFKSLLITRFWKNAISTCKKFRYSKYFTF